MQQSLITFFNTHYTLLLVLLGTLCLGVSSGALGVLAFLRQQSLLGDAISHAALPGIACAFLLTHSTNPYILLLGGALSGLLGVGFNALVTHTTPLKTDTMLGIILSVFFGFGLVLFSIIQKLPVAEQSILNKFLFGNASTLLPEDVVIIVMITTISFLTLFLLHKELKAFTFDAQFVKSIGYPGLLLECVLTILLLSAIVIGLQTVGVILMSTMLIAPAAAARQWSKNFESMIFVAMLIGGASSILGTIISCCACSIPTGPAIVIVSSVFVIIALMTGQKS